MKIMNVLRIFLASPGDVKAEREMIFALKDDLDLLIGKDKDIKFEIINWERNTYPGKGDDAQDVINGQINGEYDIFLGIFWQRFGTPTSRYESGTLEEFERAKLKFDKNPKQTHILMYFKNQEVDIYKTDLEQFKKIKEFKDKIANQDGIYYSMFEKTEDLKSQLQLNLANLVRDKFSQKQDNSKINQSINIEKIEKLDKYELLAQKIDAGEYNTEYLDLLENIEETTDHLRELFISTNKITEIMNFFTNKTTEKTNLIKNIVQIKDEKFRINRLKKISNDYAVDLDKYSDDFENLSPEFKESLNKVVESYTEITLKTIKSNHEEMKNEMLDNIPQLISSIEKALEGISGLLESFVNNTIQLTSNFSTAKRRAELSTNNIFKDLINARNLLKQLLNNL